MPPRIAFFPSNIACLLQQEISAFSKCKGDTLHLKQTHCN